ncbi:MAG: hypothetical protein EOM76_04785 [Sphingobacteriia bacterium]|nr:hypothetical protein [Sphingobacteriia bacterium]
MADTENAPGKTPSSTTAVPARFMVNAADFPLVANDTVVLSDAVDGFAATVTETSASPFPDSGDTVTQSTLTAAVHAALDVTCTLNVSPLAETSLERCKKNLVF